MKRHEEYEALESGAGQCTIARTILDVSGADAATFLHNLCTNDIKKLTPGSGCEAFFTNVKGKILAHGIVLRLSESFWIDTVAEQADVLLPHLDKYLIREEVELKDLSTTWKHVVLLGASLADRLHTFGMQVPDEHFVLVDANISGEQVRVCRTTLASSCVSLWTRKESLDTVLQACVEGGIPTVSGDTFDVKRIEFGFPMFGVDITINNLPQEVCRDSAAISFTKGCYLGQETVARLDALGHANHQLVKLKFDAGLPALDDELKLGEKTVGRVTSACNSPSLGNIGLGYVRTQVVESRSPLVCSQGGVRITS